MIGWAQFMADDAWVPDWFGDSTDGTPPMIGNQPMPHPPCIPLVVGYACPRGYS